MKTWRSEAALWGYLAPRLRGRWTRLEAVLPDGLPDAFCLGRDGRTIWMELKLGKPDPDALRAPQRNFAHACIERGIPWFCCFGHRGAPVFFRSPEMLVPVTPEFWRPGS
jgi:hypothetical protein